jgi:tRNA-2-methylthio-N6-dimethylallyladenosine synthase
VTNKRKVYIETYGCQMNEYDTELVKTIMESKDQYTFVDNELDADVVLLNTCAVRENAYNRIRGRIGALKKYRQEKKDFQIGILGCMAQNLKDELLKGALKADFVAGPDSYRELPILSDPEQNQSYAWNLSEYETYEDVYPRRGNGVNAWLAVMRGCDNFCTFCVVPYTRGRERSRSIDSVTREVRQLVADGYKQVTLLGQNVNSYRHETDDFAGLVAAVAAIDGLERIRFTSPHPKDFPDNLLRLIAENDKVCSQIHLPLQAGNTRVLDVMNRTYTRDEYLRLVDKIRATIPSIVLTTDIIVGFPTETEAEFMDTYKLMETVEFDAAFIFKYSERKGTIASRKLPDDVSEAAKTERIVRLNELQKGISVRKNNAHVGETHQVLVEELTSKKSDHQIQGRNDGNKIVIFEKTDAVVGQMVDVKITDATANVLRGTAVQ